MGMRSLTLEEIKEILRVEIRKQILWAHHVNEGTSEHDIHNRMNSLSSVSDQEHSLMKKIANDEKSYDKELDGKLTSILESLEIDASTKSVAYKQLRRHFKSLYLLRYDWARSLIKKSGRVDDDFRREADEMLSLNLYTDLVKDRRAIRDERNNEEEIIQSQNDRKEQIDDSSSLESTPLSEVIDSYLDEKSYDNEKTADKIEHALRMLVEDFGDIAINRINSTRVKLFKQNLRHLPSRRNQIAIYRDKSFHELVLMGEKNIIRAKDRLSTTSVNDILGFLSTFFKWATQNGYTDRNFFEGVKIQKKRRTHVRDERARYTDKQISKLFDSKTYLEYTIERNNFAYYWVPLIALFSGCRINEICSLYLDNIIKLKGKNSGRDIWCFNLLEEEHRSDKRLKNSSSRRIVPIHDEILNLDFLEFVKILERKKKERLFEELKSYKGHNYANSVQRFWNERYTRDLGIETDADGKRVTFHSLRHAVADTLKQANVETKFINEHQGHSQGNIDLDRYGKNYDAEILYENCTKKIVYESSRGRKINFSALKVDWGKYLK